MPLLPKRDVCFNPSAGLSTSSLHHVRVQKEVKLFCLLSFLLSYLGMRMDYSKKWTRLSDWTELNWGWIMLRILNPTFILNPKLLLFSHSVVSDCLQPYGLQYTRLPCSPLCPGVCSDSSPLSQWCHPIISPSVVLFSSCPQSFPASGSFPVSQLFTSGG